MSSSVERNRVHLLLLAFGLAAAAVVAWILRHALLLLYIAAVFATVLKPGVDRVSRARIGGWRPSRGSALLLLIAVAAIVVGVLAVFAIPPLVEDAAGFVRRAPQWIDELRARLQSIPLLRHVPLRSIPSGVFSNAAGFVTGSAGVIVDVLTVLLLIAYLILDGPRLFAAFLKTVPATPRERLGGTLERAGRRMRGWLAGQLLLMLTLGVSSAVAFGAMRIPYFYLLAVFAGIANIIPLLGPLATVILAGAIALTDSGWKVLGVLIFYLVYQQVENAFLTPRIMKSQVQLSSAVVIIALLIGGELAGIPGALVAVPSAVLVAEIADEYLVRDES